MVVNMREVCCSDRNWI